jgi:hypothetical protein
MKLICDGDSWVFGCEIVDPEISKRYDKSIHPGRYDYLEENDNYRITKIFPTILGELMNVNEVVNLSWPADTNDIILDRIITYVCENIINKGLSTKDLLIIIGWSSPERNNFWYKDDIYSGMFRLWPQIDNFEIPNQKKFWEYYIEYLWNPEEYVPRYIMNVLQFQNFCNMNNIKWLCFNSFYQTPKKNPNDWKDLDIRNELKKIDKHSSPYNISNKGRNVNILNYESIWCNIDDNRFYKKDLSNNTFKSFIEKNSNKPYNGWHPSPESHRLWAEELYNYIKNNKII